jgi:hypothetical protein
MDVKLLWNICTSIMKDLYCAIMNAKLLQNVCTSITMGLSLVIMKANLGMFVWVLWRIYYFVIKNAKLTCNVCTSIMNDLLLRYNELTVIECWMDVMISFG